MEIKEIPFGKVGIYGLCIKNIPMTKYRYFTKYPAITKEEFEVIVDQLIIECNDINYIARQLKIQGFDVLGVVADVYYDIS